MSTYEEKRQARIDRMRAKAEKASEASHTEHQQFHTMMDRIPFGQPILVGHHSEGADRRYRDRAGRHFEKAVELHEKAAYYEARADAAENNTAIYSDDPEALDKLRQKLAMLESMQQDMKTINAYYRKHCTCVGCSLLTEEQAAEFDKSMKKAYSWVTAPFPAYALQNNNGNMRWIRERIKELEARETLRQQYAEREGGEEAEDNAAWLFEGGKVVLNYEANRVQILFGDKPDEEIRRKLKGAGFRWAPSAGACQRQLTNNAIYDAKRICRSENETQA